MRDSVLALTKGWHQDHVRRIVRETLLEVVEPIVYDEAVELIRTAPGARDDWCSSCRRRPRRSSSR